VGTKVRFSVNIDEATNRSLEALAAQHKPALSKSYLVEYAVLRLIEAVEIKQLELPLVLEDKGSGRRN
jgi:hypothetical protein